MAHISCKEWVYIYQEKAWFIYTRRRLGLAEEGWVHIMKRLGLYKQKEGWVHIYHEKVGFIYSRRRLGLYIPEEDWVYIYQEKVGFIS